MVLKEKVNTQKHASWSEPNNILTRDLIDRHKEERERDIELTDGERARDGDGFSFK